MVFFFVFLDETGTRKESRKMERGVGFTRGGEPEQERRDATCRRAKESERDSEILPPNKRQEVYSPERQPISSNVATEVGCLCAPSEPKAKQ